VFHFILGYLYNIEKMKKEKKVIVMVLQFSYFYHRNMNINLHPKPNFPWKGNHQKWKQEKNNRRPEERFPQKAK